MLARALVIWLGIALLAVLNGAFREAWIRPKFGERVATLASPLLLSAAILVAAWLSNGWIRPDTLSSSWSIGGVWITLTFAFEFLAGHYAFNNPWNKIVADYRVWDGRMWPMVPIVVAFAPAMAFVGMRPEHAIPFSISNAVAIGILAAAVFRPNLARWAIAAIFAYACVFNAQLALRDPGQYQGFADLAIVPFYRDFIVGPFKEHGRELLLAIAIGQGAIAIGMATPRLLWMGALGASVFLMSIAPLGVGAAFPFSVLVSMAAVCVWGQSRRSAAEPATPVP